MAQYSSYARQGQFRGNIKAPNKAKALKRRDDEWIAALQEENRSLTERDAKFLGAYKEKLHNEEVARKEVDDAETLSIQAEMDQRIANAKLEADFAQKEQAQKNKVFEAFGEMLPKVAQYAEEEHGRRKEFETKHAQGLAHRIGLTPQEYKEYKGTVWSANNVASIKSEKLRTALENGTISYHEFNQAMAQSGAFGTAFAAYNVRQIVNMQLPEWWNGNLDEVIGGSDITLRMAVSEEQIVNESQRLQVISEAKNRAIQELAGNYNPAFFREHGGEAWDRFWNDQQASALKKREAGARELATENATKDLIGGGNSMASLNARYASFTGVDKYKKARSDIKLLVDALANGTIHPGDPIIENYRNLQIPDSSLPRGENGEFPLVKLEDHWRLGPPLDDGVAKAYQRSASLHSAETALFNADNAAGVRDWEKGLLNVPPEQQQAYLEQGLKSTNPYVRAKANQLMGTTVTAPQTYREKQVLDNFKLRSAQGLLITQYDVINSGLTGERLIAGIKLANDGKDRAEHFKEAQTAFYREIDAVTGATAEGTKKHWQRYSVMKAMDEIYKAEYRKLEANRSISKKTPLEIHTEAKQVAFDAFVNKTGEFVRTDDGNPTTVRWPSVDQSVQRQPAKPLTPSFNTYKENFYLQPNTVFYPEDLERLQYAGSITNDDRRQALTAAILASSTGNHVTIDDVIVAQLEAANLPVPADLRKVHEAQQSLLSQIPSSDRGQVARHLNAKPGDMLHSPQALIAIQNRRVVTSEYGPRFEGMHRGIDIAVAPGTPQYMMTEIRITDTNFSGAGGHGWTGEFYVGDQLVQVTSYHNQRVNVRAGQVIPAGAVISNSGSTGRSTGPHAHLEFRINGVHVNPRDILGGKPLHHYVVLEGFQ